MALAAQLSRAGFKPVDIRTLAKVAFEKIADGFQITRIELETVADVPEISDVTFQAFVADAKRNCPVSKALAAIEIWAKATLGRGEEAKVVTSMAELNR
jgi:osmotically inducible protein OsmC